MMPCKISPHNAPESMHDICVDPCLKSINKCYVQSAAAFQPYADFEPQFSGGEREGARRGVGDTGAQAVLTYVLGAASVSERKS